MTRRIWGVRLVVGVLALAFLAVALLSPFAAAPLRAQATVTFVSGVGDDANPCSRTAPCKTFAGAIAETAAGGRIIALDPGGFGAVAITKAITIESEGQTAGILAAGSTGVIVNAGASDVVILRGLDIEGFGTGLNGIQFLAGAALYVEDTSIHGFRGGNGRGIDMAVGTTADLFLSNVLIANNSGAGVYVTSSGVSTEARATLDNVRMTNNLIGLDAFDRAVVTVRNSIASGNTTAGFRAQPSGSPARLTLEASVAVYNGEGIIVGSGSGPAVNLALSDSLILDNTGGNITAATSATVTSAGDNRLDESVPPPTQTPTPTVTLTPTATLTPTSSIRPVCSPRPPVSVTTAQTGPGQFQVTVRLSTNPNGAPNTLQVLRFGPAANARIDVPNGPANSAGNVAALQPANTAEVRFLVRRETAGAFNVPFTVVDACGSWETFVGAGAGVP